MTSAFGVVHKKIPPQTKVANQITQKTVQQMLFGKLPINAAEAKSLKKIGKLKAIK